MRNAFILLLLTFTLVAFGSAGAQEFTVLAGVNTAELGTESFGDNWGYGAGFIFDINQHVGAYGTLETDDVMDGAFDRVDIATYLKFTVANSPKFALSGLCGFEWYGGKLPGGGIGNSQFDDPTIGLGLLAQYDVYNEFGVFGTATTTMFDGTELGDAGKLRLGVYKTF